MVVVTGPGVLGRRGGGLSGVRRAVMTPPLCTWDSVVGEEIERGGRRPTGGLLPGLVLRRPPGLRVQSGSGGCASRRAFALAREPAERVVSPDMNASVPSSRCAGSPRRTCDLSNEKAFGVPFPETAVEIGVEGSGVQLQRFP